MRLLYITTQSFPSPKASTVQVMQMCGAFAASGVAVQLATRDPEHGRLSESELCRQYDVPESFRIAQLPWPKTPRPADVFQLQTVQREGRGKWLCYTRGRDVTAPLMALRLGAQAVVEMHTPPISLRERLMLRLIQAHPRGWLVTLSEALIERCIRKFGFRSNSFIIAPDGVDLSRFEPPVSAEDARDQLGLKSGTWVVYVGGLYEGRGLDTLFHTAAQLPINLLIVGGRDEADVNAWQRRAENAGATNVRFYGYQAPEQVPLFLFAADILAMPYGERVLTASGEDISEWTSPLKMFEYMAAARPIVAGDLPVLGSVLAHERNALLVPPDDVDALTASIQRLLSEPELGQRLAKTAQDDVAQHTWEARAQLILESVGLTQ